MVSNSSLDLLRKHWICVLVLGALLGPWSAGSAQGHCSVCGDVNGTGTISGTDWDDYLNWLYEGSYRQCSDSATGDIDGYATVTLRDVVWMHR